jgi:hypothetical protein
VNLDDLDTPQAGDELLNRVRATVTKYVVLPSEHAVVAVVLWIVATHAVSVWEHATRLAIHSPVKRCGKSRLLEVIEALAHRALATSNISVPALYRVIDSGGGDPPTVILDEADRLFGSAKKDEDNRDLIALLNNGFRPGRPTIRCVGPSQVPTPFSTFAMAAIAGIGRKPDTIEDRAVNITMRRRLPGEQVSKFRLRTDLPAMEELRGQIAEWAQANLAKLGEPVADLPAGLEDRAQDSWEPLLAVAGIAGGSWPEQARNAALVLSAAAAAADDEQSLEIRLLADIRAIFGGMPDVKFISTGTLLSKLREIGDAPWSDFDLSARKLAMRLGKFEVGPRHNADKTARGYHLEDFRKLFPAYLPSEPSEPSGAPADQGKRPDGSKPPDGSTRPPDSSRPDETAGQVPNGRVRTVRTDNPALTWPEGSIGEEMNQ